MNTELFDCLYLWGRAYFACKETGISDKLGYNPHYDVPAGRRPSAQTMDMVVLARCSAVRKPARLPFVSLVHKWMGFMGSAPRGAHLAFLEALRERIGLKEGASYEEAEALCAGLCAPHKEFASYAGVVEDAVYWRDRFVKADDAGAAERARAEKAERERDAAISKIGADARVAAFHDKDIRTALQCPANATTLWAADRAMERAEEAEELVKELEVDLSAEQAHSKHLYTASYGHESVALKVAEDGLKQAQYDLTELARTEGVMTRRAEKAQAFMKAYEELCYKHGCYFAFIDGDQFSVQVPKGPFKVAFEAR